jgi:predicted  nucleic acid-binding Zn-ribbon protein
MGQPAVLFKLQEVEIGIIRAQQRLRQIADLLANDEVIQQAQAQIAAAQNELNPLKARLHTLEHEIQQNESKTKNTDQQLYSGAVKNPKEMQDMQQEIESLKRWHGELENTMLETMVAAEEAEASLAKANSNLAAIVASRGDEHKHLLDEQAKLQAQVEEDRQRRQQVLREVEPENLKIYTTMKPRKNQQPVALMHDNNCGFCGVAQTAAIEQEVRRGTKLINCSNCERILVAG